MRRSRSACSSLRAHLSARCSLRAARPVAVQLGAALGRTTCAIEDHWRGCNASPALTRIDERPISADLRGCLAARVSNSARSQLAIIGRAAQDGFLTFRERTGTEGCARSRRRADERLLWQRRPPLRTRGGEGDACRVLPVLETLDRGETTENTATQRSLFRRLWPVPTPEDLDLCRTFWRRPC